MRPVELSFFAKNGVAFGFLREWFFVKNDKSVNYIWVKMPFAQQDERFNMCKRTKNYYIIRKNQKTSSIFSDFVL